MGDQPSQRRCGKPGCTAPAAASLSFRYATSEVWILDLAEPHPSRYDLCRPHAEQLTVPRGWERVDERTASVESIAPARAESEEEWQIAVGGGGSGGGSGGGARRGNRYAELSAQLPRLAAEVGTSTGTGEHDSGDAAHGQPTSGAPMTSRDLSPMPPDVPGGVVLAFERRGSGSHDEDDRDDRDDPDAARNPDAPDADPDPPGAS